MALLKYSNVDTKDIILVYMFTITDKLGNLICRLRNTREFKFSKNNGLRCLLNIPE